MRRPEECTDWPSFWPPRYIENSIYIENTISENVISHLSEGA